MKTLSMMLLLIMLLTLENCGFHLKYEIKKNENLKAIKIINNNYKNNLINHIKEILNLNNIKIINNNTNNAIILKILDIIEETKVILILNNGKNEEKQLFLKLNVEITFPNGRNYKIQTFATRNILINEINSLYKNNEYEYLKKEMYEEIAQKLIYKIILIYNKIKI